MTWSEYTQFAPQVKKPLTQGAPATADGEQAIDMASPSGHLTIHRLGVGHKRTPGGLHEHP